MSKSKTSIAEHPWAWFAVFTVLAVGLMVLWWWWRLPSPPPASRVLSDHGAFGDSFAPVIGLFSSLALGAAVLSVFIQREELRLQREEMREMRKEAAAQRLAAEELAHATRRANELAALTNELADEANEIATAAADTELDAQLNQLRSSILTVRAEVQRWDELGLAQTNLTAWVSVVVQHEEGERVSGGLGWLLDLRADASRLLDDLEADYERMLEHAIAHRGQANEESVGKQQDESP